MTVDEKNRLYLNLLARSMAEFPLWAQRKREADITDKGTNAAPLSDKQPDTSI